MILLKPKPETCLQKCIIYHGLFTEAIAQLTSAVKALEQDNIRLKVCSFCCFFRAKNKLVLLNIKHFDFSLLIIILL